MFQGLSTALTALYADRQALETTGNNIANVNTAGYARETVDQSNIDASSVSFWSTGNEVGQGTQITGISRITDQFLQAQSLTAHSSSGQYNASNTALQAIQSAFNEPSSQGLQSQLSSFWSSWDDLAKNPGDSATRTAVIEQTATLTSNIQSINGSLTQQSGTSLATLKGDVTQINSYAKSIAALNVSIESETNAGVSPNALLDQRDEIVSKLSDVVGITTTPTSANGISVNIGGVALVRDGLIHSLQVDDSATPVVLRWDSDNNPATVTDGDVANATGGDVGGQMDIVNNIIPKYQGLLNTFTTNLMTTVNTQHQAGQDLNGNPGVAFLTGTDASNISINPAVANDNSLLAAAASGGGTLDSSNATAMATLSELNNGPDASYQNLVNIMGTDAQRASSQATIQQNITNNVDASVQSVQGVNLDQEMTNMVQYQRAYESAAKYLSVINTTLDSLMSIVG